MSGDKITCRWKSWLSSCFYIIHEPMSPIDEKGGEGVEGRA